MTYKVRFNGREMTRAEFDRLPSRFHGIVESGRVPAMQTPDSWGLENGGRGRQFLEQPGQPYFEDRSSMERWMDQRYGRGQWTRTPVEQIKEKLDKPKTWEAPKLQDYLE